MSEKIYHYIDCVLIDRGCEAAAAALPVTEHAEIDSSKIKETMNTILEHQQRQRLLAVTDSQSICNLLLVLNHTLSDNKISVLCGGVLHDEAALAEIERKEKMLHTADGAEHFPSHELSNGLFVDENGRLLLKNGTNTNGNDLFDNAGEHWGSLLPGQYTMEKLRGELQNHLVDLNLRERAGLALNIIGLHETGTLSDQILLFEGNELLSIGEPAAADLAELLYNVYFHDPSVYKDKLEMLIADCKEHPAYPAFLFEDFTVAFAASMCLKTYVPDAALFKNTAERILLTTEKEVI